MADFEYAFASSGTPTSFLIGDSGITGIDEAGAIAAPKVVKMGANVHILLTATKTVDELATLMLEWLRPRGYAHEGAGGPGALRRTDDGALAASLTNVDSAD